MRDFPLAGQPCIFPLSTVVALTGCISGPVLVVTRGRGRIREVLLHEGRAKKEKFCQ